MWVLLAFIYKYKQASAAMINEPEEEQGHRQFTSNFPAMELPTKNYSLEADMVTGWRPKLKVVGPIPFNFDSRVLDELIDELTSFGRKYKQRVIYLGNRFASSFKMHQQMNHQYRFKHQSAISGSFSHMAAYFKKFHSNFKSKNSGRIFRGMNPTIKTGDQVVFDSEFESGNIDSVIKVAENEYDLFMRVDTNTRGHVQWFNFTVKNFGKKKIRLNIVNFKKYKTLYSRDMRPYIYSQTIKQTKGFGWHQGGQNVKYEKKKLRYLFLEENFMEQTITYNCLSFDYIFENDWELVQFAYCPPFTYSQQLEEIKQLKNTMKQNLNKMEECHIKQEYLCQSLGGLDIPLLTITDPNVDDKNKRCVIASARIHPGETCGSHMMKGFLDFICSNDEEAKNLRKMVVFKVIPMLNPDGVVVGNFRTSLSGKDLNRQFRTSADFLIPEVKSLKQLVIKLKCEFKSRLMFFFDFHGHSVKKNVFLYGPQYEIWETNYYKTRIFPKIMATKTQIFRYYSCLFRIADFKRTTARAVLLNTIPHCYTIEASTAFYYSPEQKKDIAFTPDSWGFMGKTIAEGIKEYMILMYDQDMTKQERKQKLNELKTHKVRNPKFQKIPSRNGHFQTRLISVSSSQKSKQGKQRKEDNGNDFSQKVKDIIEQIKKEQMMRQEKKNSKEEEGHESDQFSEGGSDSESEGDDIPEEELRALHEQILDSMKEFRKNFYGKSEKQERQYSVKETKKTPLEHQKRESVKLKPTRESKGVQMIASLRKKAEQMDKMQDMFHWPKLKQQTKSFTSHVIYQSPQRERTKINFKTYLEQIDRDKNRKKGSIQQLQVQGHSEFKDTFSRV